MFKQSPSRNRRSKSIKVKHVLQLLVLLAICFWLVYQVKHSHDKKKEFDEKNAKISLTAHGSDEILRFGRKDLHPQLEEMVVKDGKHEEGEGEAEEEEPEGEGGGEENKIEEEEHDEDSKPEEKEDKGREGRDDEIDESDQEKSEMELEHEENLIDEEKEREDDDEKETEEGQSEKESSSEDHDRDGSNRNVHEAREENYKADDASSAVAHDSQAVSTETESDGNGLEKLNESSKTQSTDQEKVKNSEEVTAGQNSTGAMVAANEMAENGIPQNVTDTEDSTISNSTVTTESNYQLEVGSNLTEDRNVSLPNGEETISVLTQLPNITEGGEGNNSNSSSFTDTQRVEEVRAGESSNFSNTSDTSVQENALKINETKNKESETGDEMDAEAKDSRLSKSEIVEEAQDDSIDSSDSANHLDEHDVRTDLGTLPDIRTEGNDEEDAAE